MRITEEVQLRTIIGIMWTDWTNYLQFGMGIKFEE